MDKHTYYVGAKPAIERALRRFRLSHLQPQVGIDPPAGSTDSRAVHDSGLGADADVCADWPATGLPRLTVGIEAFSDAVDRAILRYNGATVPVDVFVRRRRLSGEA